jgi:hypothetical protein
MPTLTAIYEATLMAFRRAEGVEFESVGIIDDFSGLLAVPTLLRVSADPSSGGGECYLPHRSADKQLPEPYLLPGARRGPPQCQLLSAHLNVRFCQVLGSARPNQEPHRSADSGRILPPCD